MKVRRLPPEVVGRIAAGEVVERPANAVKELVENSLDAGARRVQVLLEPDGRSFTVVDDGVGMDEADLLLALERHATSKLASVEDLYRVATLGFRGEALPSIAAVSRMEIVSASAGAPAGTRVVVEGGEKRLVAKAAHAPGTTVAVRDLFFNLPARLAFLRQPQTEVARAVEAVERLAVARPDVAFTVTVGGREVLRTDGSGNRLDVLAALWGVELAVRLLTQHALEDGVTLDLLLGPPGEGRASRSHQHILVNGRPVSVPRLRHALEEAYREKLLKGRHPVFCLDLRLPPGHVDPNVHPQKLEVRIRDEGRVAGLVYRAAKAALDPPRPFAERGGPAVPRPPDEAPRGADEEAAAAAAPLGVREPVLRYGADVAPTPLFGDEGVPEPIGQAGQSLILAQDARGLYVVDQHAAHERVTYERLGQEGAAVGQRLLAPLVVRLSPEEAAALEAFGEALARSGFEAEPIGPREVAVRQVPVAMGREVSAEDVHELLARLAQEGRRPDVDARRALVACRSSVKAGAPLSLPEMRALLHALFRCHEPTRCPHGRPTFLFWPYAELEARLGRR
jgi:DNA mismatch repair protein MutL